MKRKSLIFGIFLVLGCIMVSSGFAQHGSRLGVFGVIDIPMSGNINMKEYSKVDYGFGAEFSIGLFGLSVLRVSGAFMPIKFDGDAYEEWFKEDTGFDSLVTEGGRTKFWMISLNWVQYIMPPTSPVRFYFCAGGGYYRQIVDDFTGTMYLGSNEGTFDLTDEQRALFDTQNNLIGLNGGIGVDIALGSSVFIFLEGNYHYVLTEGDKTAFIAASGGLRIALW